MTIREAKIIAKRNGYRILKEGWDPDWDSVNGIDAVEFFKKELEPRGFIRNDDGDFFVYYPLNKKLGHMLVVPKWVDANPDNVEDVPEDHSPFAEGYYITGVMPDKVFEELEKTGLKAQDQSWEADSNEECINALNKALKFVKTGEYIK